MKFSRLDFIGMIFVALGTPIFVLAFTGFVKMNAQENEFERFWRACPESVGARLFLDDHGAHLEDAPGPLVVIAKNGVDPTRWLTVARIVFGIGTGPVVPGWRAEHTTGIHGRYYKLRRE